MESIELATSHRLWYFQRLKNGCVVACSLQSNTVWVIDIPFTQFGIDSSLSKLSAWIFDNPDGVHTTIKVNEVCKIWPVRRRRVVRRYHGADAYWRFFCFCFSSGFPSGEVSHTSFFIMCNCHSDTGTRASECMGMWRCWDRDSNTKKLLNQCEFICNENVKCVGCRNEYVEQRCDSLSS